MADELEKNHRVSPSLEMDRTYPLEPRGARYYPHPGEAEVAR